MLIKLPILFENYVAKHIPNIILLLAIENGIEIDSLIFILSNGLVAFMLTGGGFVVLLFGALGIHKSIFDIMRL